MVLEEDDVSPKWCYLINRYLGVVELEDVLSNVRLSSNGDHYKYVWSPMPSGEYT